MRTAPLSQNGMAGSPSRGESALLYLNAPFGASRYRFGVLSGKCVRPAKAPPLTAITSPVMYSASGEQRNSTASATSAGAEAAPRHVLEKRRLQVLRDG